MRLRWLIGVLGASAAVFVLGAALLFALAWRTAIPPVAAVDGRALDPELIGKGAALAAIGNCDVCHTRPRGELYAGGRSIATPFGNVVATNITPDPRTGIGGWSREAFLRAMREGVSRDGRHLYPAFPYDHMAMMTDQDIGAVWAFMMTRKPVDAVPPSNALPFPFNVRALLAVWKLLFLDSRPFEPDPSQSPQWNRGAYLVEGLAHCGACHTPRNALGAEKRGEAYAGGRSEGWIAPALDARSPAAVPWIAERLYTYLRLGHDPIHGVAAGPMAPVARNLARVSDEDVRAIATYVAAIAGAATPERQQAAERALARAKGESNPPAAGGGSAGGVLYAGACAQCHGEAGRAPAVPALNLALSSALRTPEPDNAVRIVRNGVEAPGRDGETVMPGFGQVLTDAQLVLLIAYLRAHFTDLPAWTDLESAVRRTREADGRAGSSEARP